MIFQENPEHELKLLPLYDIVKTATNTAYNIVERVLSNNVDGLDILSDNLNTKTNKHVVAINN